MRPIVILRFSPTEGPAYFAEWLDARRLPWQLAPLDEGTAVPRDPRAFAGIGMMGGPMSVNDGLAWTAPVCALLRDAVDARVPVIGHCLGGQLLAQALGAAVTRAGTPEIGWLDVSVCDVAAQREWFGDRAAFTTFEWHYDAFALPPGATRVLTNAFNANQAYVVDDRHIGFQCHIEMTRALTEIVARRPAPTNCPTLVAGRAQCRRHPSRHRRPRRGRSTQSPATSMPGGCRVSRADAPARPSIAMTQIHALPDHLINQIAAGRGRRAPVGGAEGAAGERARRGRDADRRRPRRRRHPAHPRRRQRRRDRARRPAPRRRAARDLEARRPSTTSRRSRRWAFAARRSPRSPRCRALRWRRGPPTGRTRGESRSTAARVGADGAGGARRRHGRHRRGAVLQHAGTAEIPAHRGHRMGALRGGVPAHRARASGRRVHASAQRPRRAPVARARPARARRRAARRCVRRRRGRRRCAGGAARARGLRRAARVRDAGRGPVHVRQRAPRARPDARPRAARSLPRRAAPRPPAGVRALAHRSIPGRSTSTCIRRRAKCASANRAPSTSSSSTRLRARSRRPARSSRPFRRPRSSASRPRGCRRSRPKARPAPTGSRRGAVRRPAAGRDGARRDGARVVLREALRRARGRRAPTSPICPTPATRIRWDSRSRSSTASTCSRRTARASCWSTCTRRTSASSTSG